MLIRFHTGVLIASDCPPPLKCNPQTLNQSGGALIYLVTKEKLQHLGAPDGWAAPHRLALPAWLNKPIPGLFSRQPPSFPSSPAPSRSPPAAEARHRGAAAPHTLPHRDGEGGGGGGGGGEEEADLPARPRPPHDRSEREGGREKGAGTGTPRTHVVGVDAAPDGGGQVELSVAAVIAQDVRDVPAEAAEHPERGEEPRAPPDRKSVV